METLPRQLTNVLRRDLSLFPVLTLTGPRQSGKTTLLRQQLSPDWDYVNLEDPESREFALSDPKGFIGSYPRPVIIDEVQRAPELLSIIQLVVDQERKPGRFVLSGSHNLLLLQGVSQSLAGRTSVRHLLPLSYQELAQYQSSSVDETLFYGGFPPVFVQRASSVSWHDSYIQTYIERDVRMIRQVSNLTTFQRFLRLCAGRAAQLLDLSSLAGDIGVSHNTVREWIGVLEAGFITFRVEPFFRNFSKRIIKRPKLFFYDTGILCRLLGVRSPEELRFHPNRGHVFENWCVVEALKGALFNGERSELYFWRDKSIEVDLLLPIGSESYLALECKSGETVVGEYLDAPKKLSKFASDTHFYPGLVYGGSTTQRRTEEVVFAWRDFASTVATRCWDPVYQTSQNIRD